VKVNTLEFQKSPETPDNWQTEGRLAETINCQGNSYKFGATRAPQQPSRRNITIDRPCKTRRPIMTQQDERRHSDIGRGVWVYLGLEFTTNDSTSTRENERRSIEQMEREGV
jgi:hypothetical protein